MLSPTYSFNKKLINGVIFLVIFFCVCAFVSMEMRSAANYTGDTSFTTSHSGSDHDHAQHSHSHRNEEFVGKEEEEDPSLVDISNIKFALSIPGKRPEFECKEPVKPTYYSQIDQDKFIYEEFFKSPLHCGGVVLDIGANEGLRMSNSLFFEESLGWKSYCIEASPEIYEKLRKNRPYCHNLNAAVSNRTSVAKYVKGEMLGGLVETVDYKRVLNVVYKGDVSAMKKGMIDIQTIKPTSILKLFNIHTIDVLSIDVEGAEMGVVTSFEWDKVYVKVLSIEANARDGPKNEKVRAYLESQGFIMHKKWEWEEMYLSQRFAEERGITQHNV